MTTVGVDIEQFVVDPYGSGIQRVLQYLARTWPGDLADGLFVVPWHEEFLLLNPQQAAWLIDIAFDSRDEDLRIPVYAGIDYLSSDVRRVSSMELPACVDSWLLPEVSYLPSVLARFEAMDALMPTAMIGYDALPMTEPANYRFPPGVAANASEYFRLLATSGAVVCISEYSRAAIVDRLRRRPDLPTSVAHPGGDHVPVVTQPRQRVEAPVHFLRLGTMEERKKPLEILRAFRGARATGIDARLTYVGGRSSSYERINEEVRQAEVEDRAFRWVSDASDDDVEKMLDECQVLVSFGTEGYGIPVLEAIRRGKLVLFGGIQPAAELLVGRGAVDCGEPTHEAIQAAITRFSDPDAIAEASRTIDPEAVATWSDFARGVIGAVIEAS